VTNRDLNEGFNFRRARFGIDGKLFRDFDYSFIYEFGGSGQEDPGRCTRPP
jgi:phosphate-selective porin OprO/OprP